MSEDKSNKESLENKIPFSLEKFENHVQTVIVTGISALLIWMGYTINQSNVGIAVLRTEIKSLQTVVETLNKDAYSKDDADRDQKLIEIELRSLDRRLNNLERRVHRNDKEERKRN